MGDRADPEAGMMRGRRSLDGLDDDVRDHIDRETQENIANGMAPDEARHAALRAFGNVTRALEDTRAVWIPVWLDQLLQDARYGLRMMRRNPAFSAVVILTLAVGIGLNTAVFSVVNAVLMRPLSYPEPERLVWVATYDDRSPMEVVSAPDFLAFREQASSLDRIAAFSIGTERVTTKDEVVPARIATVSHEFWDLAGVLPALGRIPSADEESLVLNSLYLASLQEPSAFEYRGHRLFDSRRPRRRLLGRGKVVQITPLPPRRQRLEGALETRVPSEPLPQLLGNRKI
jgi:hypothetical protein